MPEIRIFLALSESIEDSPKIAFSDNSQLSFSDQLLVERENPDKRVLRLHAI
jgi:hypothetical protein